MMRARSCRVPNSSSWTRRGAPLPAGETGLLRMRTPGMATRYLDDGEATARCFVDGWFQPGDMGRLLPDGTLRVEGRGDDMMILGTLNIFPAEIERAAEGFPGVADCAAFALRSAVHGDIPMLAVVARGAPRRRRAARALPRAARPARAAQGGGGGVAAAQCRGQGAAARPRGDGGEGRMSDVATWRARIVEGVLQNPVRRVRDPVLRARLDDPAEEVRFQELGFDSLALLELSIWLETEAGAEVGEATLAEHPGVLALARHLAAA